MAYSITFTNGFSSNSVAGNSSTVTVEADGLDVRQIAVPVGADLLVNIELDLSEVKGYYFIADGALQLETNTSVGTGTAGETIQLVANQGIAWYDGCLYDKHFVGDVTNLYLTNTGDADVILNIMVAHDATP